MVSKQLTKELQIAMREECGIELSEQEAGQVLRDWANYFNCLADIDKRINNHGEEKQG